MPVTKDPRIDAFIEKAAPFARPILKHIRRCVHAGCPSVEETIKWGMPAFVHDGRILALMASFKAHAAFGIWDHRLLGQHGLKPAGTEGMGQFGRITSIDDLPPKAALVALVKAAATLRESGVKAPRRAAAKPRPEAKPPKDLVAALKLNAKARATFDALPPSGRRDYIDWITEAKRDETRRRRLATTIEWLAEGKPRNWKYQRC